MPHVKIKTPVFSDGVRVHNTGDIVEVDPAGLAKYERRGWGEAYTAPKADEKKSDGKKAEDKK